MQLQLGAFRGRGGGAPPLGFVHKSEEDTYVAETKSRKASGLK